MAFSFAPGKDLFFHQVSPLPWCAWINITSFTYISGLSWDSTANINYLWFKMCLILVTAQKKYYLPRALPIAGDRNKNFIFLKGLFFTITIKSISLFLPQPTALLIQYSVPVCRHNVGSEAPLERNINEDFLSLRSRTGTSSPSWSRSLWQIRLGTVISK